MIAKPSGSDRLRPTGDSERFQLAKWVGIAALLLALLAPGPSPAAEPLAPPSPPPNAEALARAERVVAAIRKVEARYRQIGAFRATFEQAFVSSSFGSRDQARGLVHVAPPDRMLWAYSVPKGQRGVLDGQKWWLIVPQDKEVQVRERDPNVDNPLADLLAGRLDTLSVFTARQTDRVLEQPGWVEIELVPRTPREDLEFLTLRIDERKGDLRELEVIDAIGNRTVYKLSAPTAEKPLAADAFKVVVPEGYSVSEG